MFLWDKKLAFLATSLAYPWRYTVFTLCLSSQLVLFSLDILQAGTLMVHFVNILVDEVNGNIDSWSYVFIYGLLYQHELPISISRFVWFIFSSLAV